MSNLIMFAIKIVTIIILLYVLRHQKVEIILSLHPPKLKVKISRTKHIHRKKGDKL